MDRYIIKPTHWQLRVGDGENLEKGRKKGIWPIGDHPINDKYFKNNAKRGDVLHFIKTGGIIYGVGTFVKFNKIKDNTIQWSGSDRWDFKNATDMKYENFYKIPKNWKNRKTKIQGPAGIRKYNNKKCSINLIKEYKLIKNCLNPC